MTDESAPGYLDRYVFYTRGRVPEGHEEWARRRLALARWIGVYLAIEVAAGLAVFVATVAVTGGATIPIGVFAVVALFALVAPFSAAYYRRKVRRKLATPVVSEQNGERF